MSTSYPIVRPVKFVVEEAAQVSFTLVRAAQVATSDVGGARVSALAVAGPAPDDAQDACAGVASPHAVTRITTRPAIRFPRAPCATAIPR